MTAFVFWTVLCPKYFQYRELIERPPGHRPEAFANHLLGR